MLWIRTSPAQFNRRPELSMITDNLTDGASAYGLVAVGGDLSPDRLLWA